MLNVGDQGRKAKEFLQRIQKEKDQNKDVKQPMYNQIKKL